MLSYKCIVVLFICVTIAVNHVDSGEVLDKVKDGLNVAYDKVHCGFHKLKELVKHHDHDVDPCTGKSVISTTQAPPAEYNIDVRQAPEAPTDGYGWRV